MSKNRVFFVFGLIFVLTIASQVFAGGFEKMSSKLVIGTPPEAMARQSNIALNRGKGELFYPACDLLARIYNHTIPAGDKKPGPGYGVPEGHVIGNAPTAHVIGKVMDRSGRGKGEPVIDFIERLKKHHAN